MPIYLYKSDIRMFFVTLICLGLLNAIGLKQVYGLEEDILHGHTPTPSPSHTEEFQLQECVVDSECPRFGESFCTSVKCKRGNCKTQPYECPSTTPMCNNVLRKCIQCSTNDDCIEISKSYSTAKTKTARRQITAGKKLTPLSENWCDPTKSLFSLDSEGNYLIHSMYGVFITDMDITIPFTCNNETNMCDNNLGDGHHIPQVDISFLKDVSQTRSKRTNKEDNKEDVLNKDNHNNNDPLIYPNFNTCSFNTTHPSCSSEKSACVSCLTNEDCISQYNAIMLNIFGESQYKPLHFCNPTFYCSESTSQCVFATVPRITPPLETLLVHPIAHNNNIIANNEFHSGIYIPFETIYQFAVHSEDFDDFWAKMYLQYPVIQRNPCDFIDQRLRVGNVPILHCDERSGMCDTTHCIDNSTCQDDDGCNGMETCGDVSPICMFPSISTCTSPTPYCDTSKNNTCQECIRDEQCEPSDVCMGIGYCNKSLTNPFCQLLTRCNNITETCNSSISFSAVLEVYGYTNTQIMPPIPENAFFADNDDKNPSNSYYNQETYSDEKFLQEIESGKRLRQLPSHFDWRRIPCQSIFCTSSVDCPIGTICKTYSPEDSKDKKCMRCRSDADCQDGIKCNGREVCHPEGTCRRSRLTLCEQYLLDTNSSLNIDKVTCIEEKGECKQVIQSTTISIPLPLPQPRPSVPPVMATTTTTTTITLPASTTTTTGSTNSPNSKPSVVPGTTSNHILPKSETSSITTTSTNHNPNNLHIVPVNDVPSSNNNNVKIQAVSPSHLAPGTIAIAVIVPIVGLLIILFVGISIAYKTKAGGKHHHHHKKSSSRDKHGRKYQ